MEVFISTCGFTTTSKYSTGIHSYYFGRGNGFSFRLLRRNFKEYQYQIASVDIMASQAAEDEGNSNNSSGSSSCGGGDGSMAKRIVILGGGIHGVSTAYFLAKQGVKSLIIEKESIGCAASGKAGGFLGREWGSAETVEMHQKSFDLHSELARELNIRSFRMVTTLSVAGTKKKKSHGANIAPYLDRNATAKVMDGDTAQVTPLELVNEMMRAAAESVGSEVLIGSANDVHFDESGPLPRVCGVGVIKEDGSTSVVEAEALIVCLGPWSGVFCEDHFGWRLPMEGIKSTSIVFKDVPQLDPTVNGPTPYACFCDEDNSTHTHLELYPRVDDELYICGCGGSDHVRGNRLRPGGDCDASSKIKADEKRVEAAVTCLSNMSSIGDRKPDIQQACMRPCLTDALPAMGKIPSCSGAYVSCGHNCWGILWAPISGQAMSELVLLGESNCLDLSPFTPNRFASDPEALGKLLRGRHHGTKAVGEQW
jgi:glycine/D-amino acid oxidase-like deaminating enzyme